MGKIITAPNLFVIAGPNGAGKTTFARVFPVSYTHLDVYKRQALKEV